MRILYLTQVLPYPLDAGPKTRAYYTLRHLAERHEVFLLSFVRKEDAPEHVEHLRAFCVDVQTVPMVRSRGRDAVALLDSLVKHRSFIIDRDWRGPMAQKLLEIWDERGPFDAIHADQLWMASYALWAKSRIVNPPKLVLDQHNAVFRIFERMSHETSNPLLRWGLRLESNKLAQYEAEVCRRFDDVIWVTQDDLDAVSAIPGAPALSARQRVVIPIAVDGTNSRVLAAAPVSGASVPSEPVTTGSVSSEQIRSGALTLPHSSAAKMPGREAAAIQVGATKTARRKAVKRVVFLGGLNWPPNANGVMWFLQEIWPHILRHEADAVFTVIGKSPPANVRELASKLPNVHVMGYVAELEPLLQATAAFVVPLRAGGGMRVKILDAWKWGLPVVSTTIGVEGIAVRHGEDTLIADEAQEFAEATIALLKCPDYGRRIGLGGRASLEARYDRHKLYRAWDTVYPTAAATPIHQAQT